MAMFAVHAQGNNIQNDGCLMFAVDVHDEDDIVIQA